MRPKHKEHIAVYDPHGGLDNRRRLTGRHETASLDEFTAAEGARNVSIRIPRPVAVAGKVSYWMSIIYCGLINDNPFSGMDGR